MDTEIGLLQNVIKWVRRTIFGVFLGVWFSYRVVIGELEVEIEQDDVI